MHKMESVMNFLCLMDQNNLARGTKEIVQSTLKLIAIKLGMVSSLRVPKFGYYSRVKQLPCSPLFGDEF